MADGPMQRDDQDVVGAGLDAAQRLLTAAKGEVRAIAALRAKHRISTGDAWSLEQIIHGMLVAWLDEQIEAGVLTEADVNRELDRVCAALARLEALRCSREARRG